MRIAIITDCYTPHMGGIETQTQNLAQELKRQQHHVEVVTATNRKHVPRRRLIENGIPVHRLGMLSFGFLPINPFARQALTAILRRFDVLHIHLGVISPFGKLALKVANQLGKPTLCTYHCMFGPWLPVFQLLESRRYAGYKQVHFSAVSQHLASQVQKLVGQKQKIAIIPNGLDESKWISSRATIQQQLSSKPGLLGENPRSYQLVSAIRLMPRKRPLALIKVISQANRAVGYPAFQLQIFGEGILRPFLKIYLRWTGLEDTIKLPGRLSAQELQAAYLKADAYIGLCKQESFGISAAEAIGAGLPVIGRKDSALPELVEHQCTGFLADNDRDIAQCLYQAAKLDKFRQWQIETLNRPSPVSWQRCLAATEKALHKAIELRQGSNN